MTTPRRSMSPARRQRIYRAHDGICCLCHKEIPEGEPFIVEHIHALCLEGPDDDENCGPAHERCADAKTNGNGATTYGSDSHAKAKLDRLTGVTEHSQWNGTNAHRGRLQSRNTLKPDPARKRQIGTGKVVPR